MVYDPIKAHEYYLKYRKKGLLKGRKKGKGKAKTSTKKIKQESLVGLSTGGLNDNGKMLWAMKKKELQAEMNAKLAKATDPADRKEIMEDYQSKALQELQKIKSDPHNATAKKESATKGGKSSSSGSGSKPKEKSEKREAPTSKPELNTKKKTEKSGVPSAPTKGKSSAVYKGSTKMSTEDQIKLAAEIKNAGTKQIQKSTNKVVNQIKDEVSKMREQLTSGAFDNLTAPQRAEMRDKIQSMIDSLMAQIKKKKVV